MAVNEVEEEKFIVYKSCLLALFRRCNLCNLHTTTTITPGKLRGGIIKVAQHCSVCDYAYKWQNTANDAESTFKVLFSGSVFCVGLSWNKVKWLMSLLNISSPCEATFYNTHRVTCSLYCMQCGLKSSRNCLVL